MKIIIMERAIKEIIIRLLCTRRLCLLDARMEEW